MTKSIDDLEQFIEAHTELFDCGSGASEHVIVSAEQRLQLRFPFEYRQFLNRWGTMACGGREIYGIPANSLDANGVPNAIWYTELQREREALPRHLVVLSNDDGDQLLCLDCSSCTESRVVVWCSISHQLLGDCAEGLFDFIIDEARIYLD